MNSKQIGKAADFFIRITMIFTTALVLVVLNKLLGNFMLYILFLLFMIAIIAKGVTDIVKSDSR